MAGHDVTGPLLQQAKQGSPFDPCSLGVRGEQPPPLPGNQNLFLVTTDKTKKKERFGGGGRQDCWPAASEVLSSFSYCWQENASRLSFGNVFFLSVSV